MKGSIAKKVETRKQQLGGEVVVIPKPVKGVVTIAVDGSAIRRGLFFDVRQVAAILRWCSEDYVFKHIIVRGKPGVFKAGRRHCNTQTGLDARPSALKLSALPARRTSGLMIVVSEKVGDL